MPPITALGPEFGLHEGVVSAHPSTSGGNAHFSDGLAADCGQKTTTGLSGICVESDFGNLDNLFNASSASALSNASSSAGSSALQKKTFVDQQHLQQLGQNSLNTLFSQHSRQQVTGATPNPFAAFGGMDPQAQDDFEADARAVSSSFGGNFKNRSEGNYMFVATIVDPNQEDAAPQQMLFLPGYNEVVPMPVSTANFTPSNSGGVISNPNASINAFSGSGSAQGFMMSSFASLPVVFPASSTSKNGLVTDDFALQQQSQPHQQQERQRLFALNSLEDSFAAASDAQQQHQLSLGAPALQFWSQPVSTPGLASKLSQQVLPAMQHVLPQASAPEQKLKKAEVAAMPIRPLSAYNFFFSDERERILQNATNGTAEEVFDNNKKQCLLLQHLAKDRSKRRPHRKTHGKINFTTLSKLIGHRWKSLPDERKNFYREVAATDLERYQRELRVGTPTCSSGKIDTRVM